MLLSVRDLNGPQSRPFTGAWIETSLDSLPAQPALCRALSRARGLKPSVHHHPGSRSESRPFTGAWIETRFAEGVQPRVRGRALSRARGLKRRNAGDL